MFFYPPLYANLIKRIWPKCALLPDSESSYDKRYQLETVVTRPNTISLSVSKSNQTYHLNIQFENWFWLIPEIWRLKSNFRIFTKNYSTNVCWTQNLIIITNDIKELMQTRWIWWWIAHSSLNVYRFRHVPPRQKTNSHCDFCPLECDLAWMLVLPQGFG